MINNKYEPKNFIIAGCLLFAGVLMLNISGIFHLQSISALAECITRNFITLGLGIVFILLGIYVFITLIINLLKKPTEETVYLLCIKNNKSVFIDENGKKYFYKDTSYAPKKFYSVLKNNAKITSVISETEMSFIVDEDDDSINEFVYDVDKSEITNYTPNTFFTIFSGIMKILLFLFLIIFITNLFLHAKGTTNKLILTPFVLALFIMILNTIGQLLHSDILKKITRGIYIFIFAIIFGTFTVLRIVSAIRRNDFTAVLVSIISFLPIVIIIITFVKSLKN